MAICSGRGFAVIVYSIVLLHRELHLQKAVKKTKTRNKNKFFDRNELQSR